MVHDSITRSNNTLVNMWLVAMASGGSILCSLILHNPVLIIVSDNLLLRYL